MRLREFLLLITLVSVGPSTMTVNASIHPNEPAEDGDSDATPAGIPSLVVEDNVFASAYYDALSILSSENECSEFFGGPTSSVDVFNRFVAKVRKGYDDRSVAIRMSGETVNIFNSMTHREYRLFDKVSLNLNGPFYRRRFSNSEPAIPSVGTFDPDTKEVRVLILLHELGHLLKGITGNWLIPDDGNDSNQSRVNSLKIQKQCHEQLNALSKSKSTNLAQKKRTEQRAQGIAFNNP